MAQFGCSCGNRIGLNVVPSRYDASVLGDEGSETASAEIDRVSAEFFEAVGRGRRAEWVRAFYNSADDRAVENMDDATILSDIQMRAELPHRRGMHQCERCGRLWLQIRPGGNLYAPFRPETEEWRGILERSGDDLVGYISGRDIHDALVRDIVREGDTATVILSRRDGSTLAAVFRGVAAVREWTPEYDGQRRVRFLGEWRAEAPLRRYLFDSASQSRQPLLEVIAREMEWRP